MGRPRQRRSKRKTPVSGRKTKLKDRRIPLQEAILSALSERPGHFGIKSLFRYLGLSHKDYTEYRRILHELFDNGRVERRGKRRLYIPEKAEVIQGTLRLTPHGYGFVDRGDKPSVFIGAREARKAFDGDRVKISVIDSGHEAGPEGRILEVDYSQRSPLLGRIKHERGEWLAEVRTGALNFLAKVESVETNGSLHSGDWALITVPGSRRRYPLPSCRIIDILGNPEEKGVAEKGLIASYGLSEDYPEKALSEARTIRVESAGRGVRRDLRGEFVVTIDPADAKDHDDAVSLRRDESGNYLLGVHIADVSRYVPEGSSIDEEAQKRAFSVYLQHHHLPMLPSKLPGELCSLKPGKDRLTLSVLLQIDRDGKILGRDVVASRVRIRRLISYETAQEHINKGNSGRKTGKIDPELQSQLRQMWRLASILKKLRLAEGGVDFDLPEAGYFWGEHAAPRAIFSQPRLDSHQLIEEFMLAANRAVAEIWAEKLGDKTPFIFRVHPPPDAEKRQKLSDYLADAGFEWPADKLTSAKQIASLLDEAKRRFPAEVVAVIARKTLTLARYDVEPRGHFGLGFRRYLHFTSPIRRYADLTVHRLIWKHIIYGYKVDNKDILKEILDGICQQLSERERLIAEVEREAGKLAGLLYLQDHHRDTFPARFVEATRDRLYVSLEDLFMEGVLDEHADVQFRPRRKISARYSKLLKDHRSLAVGDSLTVIPSKIDLLNRNLELTPV